MYLLRPADRPIRSVHWRPFALLLGRYGICSAFTDGEDLAWRLSARPTRCTVSYQEGLHWCRFNRLRAVVELTAPSASSGAQSAGTISEHLDKRTHLPPSTSCTEARAPWEQRQQEQQQIWLSLFRVELPISVTCVFWLRMWSDSFSFFSFFSHQHQELSLLLPRIGNVRGCGDAIPCGARVRQRGAAVSFHALFASLKPNFLGQMSHERRLISKSSGRADLRRLPHLTCQTRAEQVVSRNDNWQFGCWADMCRVTFRMQCSLRVQRIIRKEKIMIVRVAPPLKHDPLLSEHVGWPVSHLLEMNQRDTNTLVPCTEMRIGGEPVSDSCGHFFL